MQVCPQSSLGLATSVGPAQPQTLVTPVHGALGGQRKDCDLGGAVSPVCQLGPECHVC